MAIDDLGTIKSDQTVRYSLRLGVRLATARLTLLTISMLMILPIAAVCRGDESRVEHIEQAVQRYEEAMQCQDRTRRLHLFGLSEQLFRQVLEGDSQRSPIRNPDLYVNIGNAALQAERIGPAIVAYRRALQLAPQHVQASQNLAYARSLLPDWIRYGNSEDLLNSLFFWREFWSDGQVKLAAAICFLVAAAAVALGILRGQSLWRNVAILPLLIWCILTISLFVHRSESARHNAVMVLESRVYAADSTTAPARLARPLPSGAELRLVQQRERWSELKLPDGRTGWVLSNSVTHLTESG